MNAWIAARSYPELVLVCLGVCVALTLVGLGAGYAGQAFGRKIFDVPLRKGQLRWELTGTVIFHLMFVPVAAASLRYGWVRFGAGPLAQVLGFVVPWYGFQAYYYALHRAMHARPLFWMHKWHHRSVVTTPMTGFSMHPAEGVGWLVGIFAPLVLLSRFDLLGTWGFGVFFFSLWAGNIAGHANAEYMPPSTRRSTLLSNPISYHSLHHARFHGHYGFVAAIMDRTFGTEFPDWLAVHQRVRAGTPLTSIRETFASEGAPTPAASTIPRGSTAR
jgi:sterol desaturase/sphingolipid hydroxylase (fatty acid hydroxylase superfamily)